MVHVKLELGQCGADFELTENVKKQGGRAECRSSGTLKTT